MHAVHLLSVHTRACVGQPCFACKPSAGELARCAQTGLVLGRTVDEPLAQRSFQCGHQPAEDERLLFEELQHQLLGIATHLSQLVTALKSVKRSSCGSPSSGAGWPCTSAISSRAAIYRPRSSALDQDDQRCCM